VGQIVYIEAARSHIGGKDKLNSGTLIGLINRYCQDREMEIGKVEVMKTFSFFEVDEFYGDQVLAAFRGAMFDKRPIIVEPAQPKDAQRSEKRESGNRRDDKRKGFNKGSFSKKKRR
jgi:ATP-dependent RNA helicase DeaD